MDLRSLLRISPAWLMAFATISALCTFSVQAHPGAGIAVDGAGRVYFAAGPIIVMIDTNGVARTIAHDQKHERFYQLHHIQHAPGGGMLTASDMGNGIWRFGPDGELTLFYPPRREMRALAVGTGGDPFAVDRAGNVYAVNAKQERFSQILKVSPDGEISVVAGARWGFADGKGIEAWFGELHGASMHVTSDGRLLLTDSGARVREVSQDGMVTTLAGGHERGYKDGPAAQARFDGASGLALDADGNVLVAEQSGRIRKISPAGIVTTLAGSGKRGSSDGALLEATLDEPTGIAVGGNGDVYVLEPHEPRVRKIAGGRVTTIHRGIPGQKPAR